MSDFEAPFTIYEVITVTGTDKNVTIETSLGCNGTRHAASTDRVHRDNGEVSAAETVQIIAQGRCNKSCVNGLRDGGLGTFRFNPRQRS